MRSRQSVFSTLLVFAFLSEFAFAAPENSGTSFTLQVAAFPENEDAKGEEFISQLTTAGEQPIWGTVEIPGRGIWMRVFVGSFKSLAEARQYGEKLIERHLIKEFIIKKLSEIKALSRPRSVVRKDPVQANLQMKSPPMQARPPSESPPIPSDLNGQMLLAPSSLIPRPELKPSPNQIQQTEQQEALTRATTLRAIPLIPCLPLTLAVSDFQARAVTLAPMVDTDLLPRAEAAQIVVKLITNRALLADGISATGGLWLSGDVKEGLSRLKWILGKDAEALSLDKENRVQLNWQRLAGAAHLRDVSPVTAPLVLLDYISANEGLLLMVQLTQGTFRYLYHLGAKAPTLGGEVAVSGSLNLDNYFDSRINPYRHFGQKLSVERPPPGFDCLIALNPLARWFNLHTRELVQVGNITFHELTEGYAKVELGYEYLPQDNTPGAHNAAIEREMILKRQRSEVVLTAGSNRVLKSDEELQRIYAEIAAGQQQDN